jgi:hypothetical protein
MPCKQVKRDDPSDVLKTTEKEETLNLRSVRAVADKKSPDTDEREAQ